QRAAATQNNIVFLFSHMAAHNIHEQAIFKLRYRDNFPGVPSINIQSAWSFLHPVFFYITIT
ncbi:MAG: hypothetical protein V1791_02810, partial [Pseudomonadota bacterium]